MHENKKEWTEVKKNQYAPRRGKLISCMGQVVVHYSVKICPQMGFNYQTLRTLLKLWHQRQLPHILIINEWLGTVVFRLSAKQDFLRRGREARNGAVILTVPNVHLHGPGTAHSWLALKKNHSSNYCRYCIMVNTGNAVNWIHKLGTQCMKLGHRY